MEIESIRKSYQIDNYYFKHYTDLTDQEAETVLSARNDINVRKWMLNTSIISLEEHLAFIQSLRQSENKAYWLVHRENKAIGSVNISDINKEQNTAMWGFYLFSEYIGSGFGFELEFYSLVIFYNEIGLRKTTGFVLDNNKDPLRLHKLFNFQITKEQDNLIYFELLKDDWDKLPKSYLDFRKSLLSRRSRDKRRE